MTLVGQVCMTEAAARCLALVAIALSAGCATPAAEPGADGEITLYAITHGWHTGLAMRASDIDFERWRPLPHPGDARYVEVGWGDRDYYPAPRFNLWYAFKALAWPTPGVLHVVGFDQPPQRTFPRSEVLELRVSRPGFERLLAYISGSFEPDAAPLAQSLYATGAFYPSREKFHLFKTCNVWVARGLRSAGIDVRSSLTTEGLMEQLRPRARRSRSCCAAKTRSGTQRRRPFPARGTLAHPAGRSTCAVAQ